MSKIVISYINFFDNEMMMKLVEADCWKDAISQCQDWFGEDAIEVLVECESMEGAKSLAFDMDLMFDTLLVV
ncbi:coil containing protein [Aeromonas phage vB_AspA_Tola]|nr:coil containing protein [Aeromonas phage vB_AspA_Tola]